MSNLYGFQKKYLRGIAHNLKPVIIIGQKGVTDSVIKSIKDALDTHELIKLKFIDFKEKKQKEEILKVIIEKNLCEVAGIIGHIATLYKQNKDTEKQKITLPVR